MSDSKELENERNIQMGMKRIAKGVELFGMLLKKLKTRISQITRSSHIYYENINPMWNRGAIYVYVEGKT